MAVLRLKIPVQGGYEGRLAAGARGRCQFPKPETVCPWFAAVGASNSMDIRGYLLITAGAAFLCLQVLPFIRARHMRGKPVPRVADLTLPASGRVLIYFFSKSCGMCRSMTPQIQQLANDHPSVFQVDVAEAPELARGFAVMGTPTTVLVRDGRVERIWVGTTSQAQLRRAIAES